MDARGRILLNDFCCFLLENNLGLFDIDESIKQGRANLSYVDAIEKFKQEKAIEEKQPNTFREFFEEAMK